MVVGFIVEGPSDKFVVESDSFTELLASEGLQRASPVVVAGGDGRMSNSRISDLATLLRKQATDARIILLLADLDENPDGSPRCISERKDSIGSDGVDVIVIARKAIETWFLADTKAMRSWTGDDSFFEPNPETRPGMPWNSLKEIGVATSGRGPGRSKPMFAKRFVRQHGFHVERAAEHPECPSAGYFLAKIAALGEFGETGR